MLGDATRLANVIEHADALGSTLLFSRVDAESDLRVVDDALALAGTIPVERLWISGALAGLPAARLVREQAGQACHASVAA